MSASPRYDVTPRVVGIQIGQIRHRDLGARAVRTAIRKTPVIGQVAIHPLGLEGDAQADRRHHGGPERAVCVYTAVALEAWTRELGRPVGPGAFGENLTVSGWTEQSVHLGDRFRVGSALLEVSQPREPCANLAAWMETPDLMALVRLNYRTGWYCRVVEPGEAGPGLPFIREAADPNGVTVAEAYRVRQDKSARREEVRRLLDVAALSSGWKVSLAKRL